MMAEGDLGRPELGGGTIEDAATQARAQRAGGFPSGIFSLTMP